MRIQKKMRQIFLQKPSFFPHRHNRIAGVRQPTPGKLSGVVPSRLIEWSRNTAISAVVSCLAIAVEGVMKHIAISLDVLHEDHENVPRLLEGFANRIAYNHPRIAAVRWLDDSVVKPKLVPLRSNASRFEHTAN